MLSGFKKIFKAPGKSISHAEIFSNLVGKKVSFSPKDFQRNGQADSIRPLSSIVKMRLTMTIES